MKVFRTPTLREVGDGDQHPVHRLLVSRSQPWRVCWLSFRDAQWEGGKMRYLNHRPGHRVWAFGSVPAGNWLSFHPSCSSLCAHRRLLAPLDSALTLLSSLF